MNTIEAVKLIDEFIMTSHKLKDMIVDHAYPSEVFYVDQAERLFEKSWSRILDDEKAIESRKVEDIEAFMEELGEFMALIALRYNTLYHNMIEARNV